MKLQKLTLEIDESIKIERTKDGNYNVTSKMSGFNLYNRSYPELMEMLTAIKNALDIIEKEDV